MNSYYRVLRKSLRRFYRKHREDLELIGDFLGALSIFGSLFIMYITLWILGIGC